MGRPTHSPEAQRSMEELQAARAKAVRRVHELLEAGPMTVGELYQFIEGQRPTLDGYMRYMHKTLRTVHPTNETVKGARVWALGEDPNLPTRYERLDRLIAPKRGVRPAV